MVKTKKEIRIEQEKYFDDLDAIQKIQFWFFAYPEKEFGLNELVEHLGISKTTANRVVNELIDIDFLCLQEIGNMYRISVNQSHSWNLTRKVPFYLQHVYESGIVDEILAKYPSARSIILFGSYRKGDDISTSDLDVAVEVLDDNELEVTDFGTLSKLGYRTNVPVSLHIFSRNHINMNLFTNIANGIVLYGLLEVRP